MSMMPTEEEKLASLETAVASMEATIADYRESHAALTKLIERERKRSETLVDMVRRGAKEMPRKVGRDLLDDLEKLLESKP